MYCKLWEYMYNTVACEQALYFGDIVKSRRARGTQETRKRGAGEKKEGALRMDDN